MPETLRGHDTRGGVLGLSRRRQIGRASQSQEFYFKAQHGVWRDAGNRLVIMGQVWAHSNLALAADPHSDNTVRQTGDHFATAGAERRFASAELFTSVERSAPTDDHNVPLCGLVAMADPGILSFDAARHGLILTAVTPWGGMRAQSRGRGTQIMFANTAPELSASNTPEMPGPDHTAG